MTPPNDSRGDRSPGASTGAVLIAWAALACGGGEPAEAPGAAQAVNVDAVVAWQDTLRVTARAVGSLAASARVNVAAETEGRISEIRVREGEAVESGQVLLALDRRTLLSDLRSAEAALESAVAEEENLARQVERNEGLLEAGAISQQAYDDMRTALASARARVSEARARVSSARDVLEDATVRAPFDGQAGERYVDPGEYVVPGDPLMLVVDNDPLEIEFTVPERYAARVEVGSPVTLRVGGGSRDVEGEVAFISPVVDTLNRTVRIDAEVANPESELRAGQFANVVLGLESVPEAVLVPEAAIVPRGGDRFVFITESGAAARRTVELGQRVRGLVQITSGVRPGDTVVVAGQARLEDGTPLSVALQPGRPEPVPLEPADGS